MKQQACDGVWLNKLKGEHTELTISEQLPRLLLYDITMECHVSESLSNSLKSAPSSGVSNSFSPRATSAVRLTSRAR